MVAVVCLPTSPDFLVVGKVALVCLPNNPSLLVVGVVALVCLPNNPNLLAVGVVAVVCLPNSPDLLVVGKVTSQSEWHLGVLFPPLTNGFVLPDQQSPQKSLFFTPAVLNASSVHFL
jgi:hypothetical protein